jgi:hypothetical protein
MNIFVYGKVGEDTDCFKIPLAVVRKGKDPEVFFSSENKRSFRELEAVRTQCQSGDALIVKSLASFGVNDAEIAEQLELFLKKSVILVVCDIPATYEYGAERPINSAVINTILQSALKGCVTAFHKPNAGRNRIEFPENWKALYEKWERKELTSKEFIRESGLKKATFYNLMTEYKKQIEESERFIKNA